MPTDKEERQQKLADIFTHTADAILKAVSSPSPSASTLNAARLFLSDNGVTLEVLRDWKRGLGLDMSKLPVFPKDDDEGPASTQADPLRVVEPFVAEDD